MVQTNIYLGQSQSITQPLTCYSVPPTFIIVQNLKDTHCSFFFFWVGKNTFIKERQLHVQWTQRSLKINNNK